MTQSPRPTFEAAMPADLSGRQLGDFRLLRRLGHGAMADVYLADQLQLRRRVAVKVLKPELARDGTYLTRFQREAQAAASLVHANIVQIYEVGQADGVHYIAQEYVEGQNLRDWLARHGPPDLPHALSIMCQTTAALAKAGEQGIVHRDIKPENILLTRSGEVKVADFGLARSTRESAAADLTQVGMTMGTPLYMSPEQIEGKALDHRSDLYSLGVTCYHLLAGKPPFGGETALGVAVQHLKAAPTPLEDVRADLPAALCRIVDTLLAKSPFQRYPSARVLLRELRRVQVQCCGEEWPEDLPGWEPTGSDTTVEDRAATTQQLATLMQAQVAARAVSARRWWWGAAVLLALLGGGLAGWFAWAGGPLLAEADNVPPSVPPQPTVARQWYFASQVGTASAWQSVIDNFPEERYWVVRAQQQLALIYLHRKDYPAALDIFNELAAVGNAEPELLAFGLAGQYVVYTMRDEAAEADRAREQLWPQRRNLQNPQMLQLLFVVLQRRGNLEGRDGQQWERWIEEQSPPPG
jgi:serine/threonine-protein kinase